MCSPSTKRRRRRRSTSAPVDLNQIHTKLKVNMKRQNPDGSLLRSLKFACKLDSLATLNEGNNPSRPATAAAASSSWTSSAFASHFDHHELLDNSGSSSSKNMQNYQWPSISTMSACTTSLPISSPSSVDLFKALEKIENLTISYNDDFVQAWWRQFFCDPGNFLGVDVNQPRSLYHFASLKKEGTKRQYIKT